MDRRRLTALASVMIMMVMSASAFSGSSTYDMQPLLNAQHPFAQDPTGLPTGAVQPHNAAPIGAQYSTYNPLSEIAPSAGPPPEPKADDTLVELLGLSPSTPPQQAQAVVTPQMAAGPPPAAKSGDPSFITIGGGWYDFNDNEEAVEFRAEWRGKKLAWVLKPFAGVMGTTDAAIYGYGGFLTDFFFGRRIVVSPSFAVGLYEDGDGKDLGSVIEFRSALEVGWRFDNRARLSAMVYHISNAGIDDNNPGTEVFSVGYSFPLD